MDIQSGVPFKSGGLFYFKGPPLYKQRKRLRSFKFLCNRFFTLQPWTDLATWGVIDFSMCCEKMDSLASYFGLLFGHGLGKC